MSDIVDLQQRALEIRKKYDDMAAARGKAQWGAKERAMGFVVDMGELMEFIMAKEGLREIDGVDEKLAHELADCLWSLLCIADYYDVNLEAAFTKTMDHLEQRIARMA